MKKVKILLVKYEGKWFMEKWYWENESWVRYGRREVEELKLENEFCFKMVLKS